jgi:hypothetical protein
VKRSTKPSTKNVVALGVVVAFAACGRERRDLALDENPRGGTSGSAGSAGAGGSGGRARGGAGGTGTATGGVGAKYVEPTGRSVTTFLHGIVDADRVAFCFARHDEAEPVLTGNPKPPDGLGYAQSFSFETLADIELETTPVLPYAIAGDLELIFDMTCDEAVETARDEMDAANPLAAGGASGTGGEAGMGGNGGEPEPPRPPALRVTALPEIPAGSLSEGYSSLYVAVGCMGGPAFTHELEGDACGRSYAPDSPTASAVFVTLSRRSAYDKLALQALHASLASPTLTVSSAPPDIAVQPTVPVIYDLRRGMLAPRPPYTQLSITEWGVAGPDWRALVSSDGTPLFDELWADVLERAGIDAFENGRGYTLVVVGPRGDISAAGFWNRAAVGLVDNDPEP